MSRNKTNFSKSRTCFRGRKAKVVLKISAFEVNVKGNERFIFSRFYKHNFYEPKKDAADLNQWRDVKVLLMPSVLYSNNSKAAVKNSKLSCFFAPLFFNALSAITTVNWPTAAPEGF